VRTAVDWFDSEPTEAELAAIEAEWPVIAAELARLDVFDLDTVASLDERPVRSWPEPSLS
jgi:hypothetical protein